MNHRKLDCVSEDLLFRQKSSDPGSNRTEAKVLGFKLVERYSSEIEESSYGYQRIDDVAVNVACDIST